MVSSTRRTSWTSCVNVKDARPTPHVSRRMDVNNDLTGLFRVWVASAPHDAQGLMPSSQSYMHALVQLRSWPCEQAPPRPQPVSTGQGYCIDV